MLFDNFPIPLSMLLTSPGIMHNYLKRWDNSLPLPGLKGHWELASFYGYSNQAYRTQLSRSKRKKELSLINILGIDRLEVKSHGKSRINYYQEMKSSSGYTLMIFSFPTGDAKKRYRLKELLKDLKLIMINPNVFIGWGVDKLGLNKALIEEELEEFTQVFFDIKNIPLKTRDVITSNSDLNIWGERIIEFRDELDNYLNRYPKESEYRLFALMLSGLSLYNNILLPCPALPETFLPELNIIRELDIRLKRVVESEKSRLLADYLKYFNI